MAKRVVERRYYALLPSTDIHSYCFRHANTAYAYFYFSLSDSRKQSDADLLRSLIIQLGQREPGLAVLHQAYRNLNQSGLGTDDLEIILLACVRSYDKVNILMDAVDECPDVHDIQENVLRLLERPTQKASNLQIFVSSRETEMIREMMDHMGCESLSIHDSTVDSDIRKYVAAQLCQDRKFRTFDSPTRDLMEQTIASKADGMLVDRCRSRYIVPGN